MIEDDNENINEIIRELRDGRKLYIIITGRENVEGDGMKHKQEQEWGRAGVRQCKGSEHG